MVTDLYQEYLYVIGKLKDLYGVDIDVEHKDIHTFYLDKKPLFKLFFGEYVKDQGNSIVVSYHIDLKHFQVIDWFIKIYRLHPLVQIHDSYIEDAAGETYLGADAETLKETYLAQQILKQWLGEQTEEEIREFVETPVIGRDRDVKKLYDTEVEKDKAIKEFNRMRKPVTDDEVQ